MACNGYKVLDCDLHVIEPVDLWRDHIAPEYRDQAPVGSHEFLCDMYLRHDGKVISRSGEIPIKEELTIELTERAGRMAQFEEFERRGWGPDTQLEAMDQEGIDAAVLFPTRGFYAVGKVYDDDGLAAAIAHAYNVWLAEFCAADPDRLYGTGLVAPQHIESAVEEVRRIKEEFGFKAVFLRPNPVRGRNWHDPDYDPLWDACQRHGLAVGFHEGWPSLLPVAVGERFDGTNEDLWLTEHVACHPVEQMYAALCLINGGVLERFPELRVGFLECNCSWVPYWLWRMDEHWEHRERFIKDKLPLKPSQYFKRQCFASIEAEEAMGKHFVEWMGDDNLVFSTDYPHEDSRFPEAVKTFLDLPLAEESKRKILWDNCVRLYDLA